MLVTTAASELKAQVEAQKATQEFQRAVEILRAAKETIALAEERLLEEDSRHFDSAWQEMLNHATHRVQISTHPPNAEVRGTDIILWMASGGGGRAGQDAKRSRAQENRRQLPLLYQPHETAREETQTLYQQVQVCAS